MARFDVDARTGLRVSGECARPHARRAVQVARWPALASPWLSADMRQASRLPPLSPDRVADGRDAAEELRIEGLADHATLATGEGQPLRLSLRAIGSPARVRWLLDGRLVAETVGDARFIREFEQTGEHTLTAVADNGAWSRVRFRVL